MTLLAALACVGPGCSDAVPATGTELLGVAVVVLALAAAAGAVFAALARYNG
jgi:hypothetical protein